MGKRDLALAAGALLLLAVAIVRLAVPDRSRIRPLSLHGFDIASEPIKQGQTLTREQSWDPPDDVYIVGWNPKLGAPGSGARLLLRAGETRLFAYIDGNASLNQGSFPSGTGFLLRKGHKLTFRFVIANTGQDSETRGAEALVYFVPVEGN